MVRVIVYVCTLLASFGSWGQTFAVGRGGWSQFSRLDGNSVRSAQGLTQPALPGRPWRHVMPCRVAL